MSLVLHIHPLASFCHKVLIALYENGTPFEARTVDFSDPDSRAGLTELWPFGKIPVLRDEARRRTIPETSIIIEYVEQHYPGAQPLLPRDAEARLDVRLWDRIFDHYVQGPVQKMVADRLRPEDGRDPLGVAEARATLGTAYGMIDRQVSGGTWAVGNAFTLADCAAAPALFYADIVEPFAAAHPHLAVYFERLLARPSVARVIAEARPWFHLFPFADRIPERFRGA